MPVRIRNKADISPRMDKELLGRGVRVRVREGKGKEARVVVIFIQHCDSGKILLCLMSYYETYI